MNDPLNSGSNYPPGVSDSDFEGDELEIEEEVCGACGCEESECICCEDCGLSEDDCKCDD